jgi:hypothetical protein
MIKPVFYTDYSTEIKKRPDFADTMMINGLISGYVPDSLVITKAMPCLCDIYYSERITRGARLVSGSPATPRE